RETVGQRVSRHLSRATHLVRRALADQLQCRHLLQPTERHVEPGLIDHELGTPQLERLRIQRWIVRRRRWWRRWGRLLTPPGRRPSGTTTLALARIRTRRVPSSRLGRLASFTGRPQLTLH